MKKIMVDAYKLEKISSRMAKEFGSIPRGREELYVFMLHPMESNLLKLHRQNRSRNGRHALEAIQISLLKVDGYLREIEYDFSRVINVENQAFLQGILMSIDPFTNPEIYEIVIKNSDGFAAKEYFELPIKCLLRIEKSIQLWTREWGRNGYFEFIEQQMGHLVKPDDKMDFSVRLKEEDAKRLEISALE